MPIPLRCFSRDADVTAVQVSVERYLYNVLHTLAYTVEKLSIALFDKLSFGPISQSVYLLQQR